MFTKVDCMGQCSCWQSIKSVVIVCYSLLWQQNQPNQLKSNQTCTVPHITNESQAHHSND